MYKNKMHKCGINNHKKPRRLLRNFADKLFNTNCINSGNRSAILRNGVTGVNALDIENAMEILETIKTLNKENNITIITVLHDLNMACEYSDEIIINITLKDGDSYSVQVPA